MRILGDFQAGGLRLRALGIGVKLGPFLWWGPRKYSTSSGHRRGSDLLARKYVPPGRSTRRSRSTARRLNAGWSLGRTPASANGKDGSSRVATTTTPRGWSRLGGQRRIRRPGLGGGHRRRELLRAGQNITPPVSSSRPAEAVASRWLICRW